MCRRGARRVMSVYLLAAVVVLGPTRALVAQRLVWQIEAVDTLSTYTSLALNGSGWPHISYCGAGDDLKYAYCDGSGWHIETVYSWGSVGTYSSLALDGAGNPHISYDYWSDDPYDPCHYLKYAYRDASGWHGETVAYNYSGQSSLALDGADCPHVSYCHSSWYESVLRYAYRDTSGWHYQTVDAGGYEVCVGAGSSLALDGSDWPHISYRFGNSTSGHLKYAYQDASGWHTETVDACICYGGTSLALDQSGDPHVSYYEYTSLELKYAYRDATGWHTEGVDVVGWVTTPGYHTSLALDGSGYPHISYYDDTNADLKYAHRDASGWHTETVDATWDVGLHNSLALDGSGYPHVSYHEYWNGDLKYARALAPTPIVLTGTLVGGELVLSWTAVAGAAGYWVYGADNLAYFGPGLLSPYTYRLAVLSPPFRPWSSANGIGDPDHNWSYLVLAVNATEQVLGLSNRAGEHDFATALSD